MDILFSIIMYVASLANESRRRKIIASLHNLAVSLESEDDTMERIMFMNLQLGVVRIGIDLKIFDVLAASKKPLDLDQLAKSTSAHPLLLGRLLRYLAAHAMIQETGKDIFAATNVTQALAKPGNQAGIYHYFDHVGLLYQALPDFLAESGYQNITDDSNTVYQYVWKTNQTVFQHYPHNQPEAFAYFNQHMAARRESMPTWLSVYPLAKEIQGWDSEAPIFVDVGGGIGQQCAELLAKYPDLSGRVVLEDLGHCIDQALPTVGVKNVVQDIFTAQQVLGAKYYHLRGVLHDFPDDKCRKILLNIIQALRKGSLVLIEEMVIPNKGVHREATEVDLTMMCGFAAIERTEAQWRSLLDSVGLRILKVHEVLPSIHETLLVAVTR